MIKPRYKRQYDLGERTLLFAKEVRKFVKLLPKTQANQEDTKSLLRSSGSVGANYIKADEALSKPDFMAQIKMTQKEARECKYWLECMETKTEQTSEQKRLIQEATELMNIFGTIFEKAKHHL